MSGRPWAMAKFGRARDEAWGADADGTGGEGPSKTVKVPGFPRSVDPKEETLRIRKRKMEVLRRRRKIALLLRAAAAHHRADSEKQRTPILQDIIDGIARTPEFNMFTTPFSQKILPDYGKFVKKRIRMDLSAISKNLRNPGYPSAEKWMDDVRRIKSNAQLYHEADAAVHPRPQFRRGAPNAKSACIVLRFTAPPSHGGQHPRVLVGIHSATMRDARLSNHTSGRVIVSETASLDAASVLSPPGPARRIPEVVSAASALVVAAEAAVEARAGELRRADRAFDLGRVLGRAPSEQAAAEVAAVAAVIGPVMGIAARAAERAAFRLAPNELLGPLLEWPDLIALVLTQLDPTACALLARVAKPWLAVVVANNLPRAQGREGRWL